MSELEKHTDDLKMIRKMMEDSSRFLSLSGLSGVFVGIFAIIGAVIAWIFILGGSDQQSFELISENTGSNSGMLLFIDGALVLVAALLTSSILAIKKSRTTNKSIWGPVTRRLLFNLSIPLVSGALFISILLLKGNPEYLASAMLIFYGLALVNAGKFTFDEVQYLGILEIIIGLFAALFPQSGLIFWVAGFGVLHILYGIILHKKYQ